MRKQTSTFNQSFETKCKTNSHHVCAEILASEVPFNQPLAPQPSGGGFIYARRNLLCIEHLGRVPVDRCIKSNAPADRVVKIQLRSPKAPETWWGKCPRRLTIGLSKGRFYQFRLQQNLARLGLLASLICFWGGLILNPWFFPTAIGGFLLSSLLNSITPLWFGEVSREFTSVNGVSSDFLSQFPQCDEGDHTADIQSAKISRPHF